MTTMMQPAVNVGADEFRRQAAAILAKPHLTREDSARFDRLMNMADRLEGPAAGDERRRRHVDLLAREFESEKMQNFRTWIRNPERRDLSIGSGNALTGGSTGGFFVPIEFSDAVWQAARAFDRLMDSEVVTALETDNGRPISIPVIDDTSASAHDVGEAVQENATDIADVGALNLAKATLWRSDGIKISRELVADNAVDLVGLLGRAFGIRFSRGIGKAFLTSLMSSAVLGATATGSGTNTGNSDSAATTLGSDDLWALVGSVDSAYANAPGAGWLMNLATLIQLHTLKNKQGQPVFPPDRDAAGNYVLLERPVYISPSMDAATASKKPIAFGDLKRFIARIVTGSMELRGNVERFAEFGQVYYTAHLRANGGLQFAPGGDAPMAYLQMHS